MALISCTDCGREVSDNAKACPQCGRKINDKDFRLGFVVYLGLIVVGCFFTFVDKSAALVGGPILLVGSIMFVIHLVRKFLS